MHTSDLIIRGGTVITSQSTTQADIAITAGKIIAVSPNLPAKATTTIDATGLHIFPGLIDSHVHFNEPGRTDWEGVSTGSSAFAAGGGTTFFDMPLNSSPPTLDAESFDAKHRAAEVASHTDFALWGGLTPNNLNTLAELADRGVIAFKAFMCDSGIDDFARADDHTLEQGMKTAASLGLPLAVHAEDQDLTSRPRKPGPGTIPDYLASRPIEAELTAIARAIALAEKTGCALHIVHVSSPEACALITRNKTRISLTAETCPHYLALTESDLARLGSIAKCSPPLRSPAQAAALWSHVLAGDFDTIGSDHSPSPLSMKQSQDFFAVWGGIAGVQSTLSILLTLTPHLPLEQIARLTAANVAKRFALPAKGHIAPGYDADLALVNLSATYTLKREDLLDRHKLSPYIGRTFRGVVHRTILRGRTIYQDGKILAPPQGRLLKPTRRPAHA